MSKKEAAASGPALGWLISKAAASLGLRLSRAFAEAGLAISPEQFGVLAAAAREPDRSQAHVARALGRDGPSMTRLADGLDRAGLLGRESRSDDRRAYRLVLTAKGKEVLAAAERVSAREEAALAAVLAGTMPAGSSAVVAESMKAIVAAYAAKR